MWALGAVLLSLVCGDSIALGTASGAGSRPASLDDLQAGIAGQLALSLQQASASCSLSSHLDGPSYSNIASPSGHIIAVKLAHGRRHRQHIAVRLLDESRPLQFLLILCLVLCRLSSCGVHAAKRRNLRTLRMRCAWCCTPTRRSA